MPHPPVDLAPDLQLHILWSNRVLRPIQRRSNASFSLDFLEEEFTPPQIEEAEPERPEVLEAYRMLEQAHEAVATLFVKLFRYNQSLPGLGEEVCVNRMTFRVDNRSFFLPSEGPQIPMICYELGCDDYAGWAEDEDNIE
ncbi:hypothetical protein [Hymenobacter daecheongensis]|uniref:hypothetical protein n=1 Tax=Hymenobacter daecheongensis TaxID=496053 RepID=UPI00093463B8|nr:hypothetical protein [Hymenobacter daecheongensis]